jgi:hypothetical protein
VQAAIAASGVAALPELMQASRSTKITAGCANAATEMQVETAKRTEAAIRRNVFMVASGFGMDVPAHLPGLSRRRLGMHLDRMPQRQ